MFDTMIWFGSNKYIKDINSEVVVVVVVVVVF